MHRIRAISTTSRDSGYHPKVSSGRRGATRRTEPLDRRAPRSLELPRLTAIHADDGTRTAVAVNRSSAPVSSCVTRRDGSAHVGTGAPRGGGRSGGGGWRAGRRSAASTRRSRLSGPAFPTRSGESVRKELVHDAAPRATVSACRRPASARISRCPRSRSAHDSAWRELDVVTERDDRGRLRDTALEVACAALAREHDCTE